MFRKANIYVLLLALAVLVGIYFIIDYTRSDDRTFRSKVLSFDPATITAISISDAQTGDSVMIAREGEEWLLYSKDKTFKGDPDAVNNAMAMLNELNTERIVATKAEKWADYKVDKAQAVHVRLYDDGKETTDAFIGKFDFSQVAPEAPGRQPQTKMTSYVRPGDEKKVYAVNGLIRSNFQGGATPFRNRRVFYCNDYSDISKVTITGPEKSMVLNLEAYPWTLNGMAVDSMETVRYLRGLAHANNSGFVDDVDLSAMTPAYTLLVEGTTFDPAMLKAFPADSATGYYITTSINEGTVFDGSKAKLFEKLFAVQEKFLPEE